MSETSFYPVLIHSVVLSSPSVVLYPRKTVTAGQAATTSNYPTERGSLNKYTCWHDLNDVLVFEAAGCPGCLHGR